MDFLTTLLALLIIAVALFLLLKPKIQPKSKEQKQEEIRLHYLQQLQVELVGIENVQERQRKKIALLQRFAKELEFNLFFDKKETQNLIKELASF